MLCKQRQEEMLWLELEGLGGALQTNEASCFLLASQTPPVLLHQQGLWGNLHKPEPMH